MANALGNYNETFFAQEALLFLRNRMGMFNTVYRGYDAERATRNLGDTINIRRPSKFIVQDAPSTAQDMATDSMSLLLNRHKEVKFKLLDSDFSKTGRQIIDDHIQPAALALANYLDQDLADLSHHFGPIVTAAGATYVPADIVKAHKLLFDNQVPMEDMTKLNLMIGSSAQSDFLSNAAFGQWNGAGAAGAETQRTGVLGSRYGFGNIFPNQNVTQLNYAAFTLTTPTVSANTAKGSTTLAIAATTVNAQIIPKGFAFTIAGQTQTYAVTAAVTVAGTAGATVSISPPLAQDVTATLVITPSTSTPIAGVTTKDQNLAYHRNAIGMAFARLPDYTEVFEGASTGVKTAVVQDEQTNLALRVRIFLMPDASELRCALDVLYGRVVLDPNLGGRLRAA